MVRVEDLNITFFHMAKNAGSSIEKWLETNLDADVYRNDLRHSAPISLEPMFGDFGWSFCCVRNPWDRMVSWYTFFKGQGEITLSFFDYMNACFEPSLNTAKYIKPINKQMLFVNSVDYVIKYENLVEDFKVVQEKTNCFAPIGHHNKSQRTKYRDYYDNDTHINMVGDYFRDEIVHFNYEF